MKVGITGQAGFVGTHLWNTLGLSPDVERVAFEDGFFEDNARLRDFVRRCDVIVHLAAVNRHESQEELYRINVGLCQRLIDAMEAEGVAPHVLFSSSTQEERDNLYGRSKRDGRRMLEQWAERNGGAFTGLVVPNVYGEFARPGYNTFVATFAHKLVNGEEPTVIEDSAVRLIYVGALCRFIIARLEGRGVRRIDVPWDLAMNVTQVLDLFRMFKDLYFEKGIIPELKSATEVNLFNTFRSYIAPRAVELTRNVDERGMFVETVRLGVGGQVSFSTTVPGVTRGNHYHTRKIERFTVLKGRARIELRRVGTTEVHTFELNGASPAYVDMPVWWTHNIANVGTEELYTQFWINEWYNPADGDTYFEKVRL